MNQTGAVFHTPWDAIALPGMAGRPNLSWYGLHVGARLLLRGKVRGALPYLWAPVNYWRHREYPFVLKWLEVPPRGRVFDLSSPKLLAAFIARRMDVRVISTDISERSIAEARLLSDAQAPARLIPVPNDGRFLPYADDSFDFAYSVSALEHIEGEGDREAARELGRVLRPGARCVIAVPFAPSHTDDYRAPSFYWADRIEARRDGKVFYQRRYDLSSLHERIIRPSGLRLEHSEFHGERPLLKWKGELCDVLGPSVGPLHALASRVFHQGPVSSPRQLAKPLAAFLVLRKP